jgi:hypothetical protein
MRKLGLIQSRGLGDIIIALPIAKYFHDRGWHVVWPIDQRFLPSFAPAVDYVEFIPLEFTASIEGFLLTPMRLLKAAGCERIIPLYSHLTNTSVANADLARSLKFDEYKYAIAGVPFREKWNLNIKRNPEREQRLFDQVVRSPRYAVRQLEGSNCRVRFDTPETPETDQTIDITPLTNNIFDWLLVLERATSLVLIDSCYANLVEQLGLPVRKTFILRSPTPFTPVLCGAWHIQTESRGGATQKTSPTTMGEGKP